MTILREVLMKTKRAKSMILSSVSVWMCLCNQGEKLIVFNETTVESKVLSFLVSNDKLNYTIFFIQPFT